MFGSDLLDHCCNCQNFVTTAICQPCSENFKENKADASYIPMSFLESSEETTPPQRRFSIPVPQLVLLDTILSGCDDEEE